MNVNLWGESPMCDPGYDPLFFRILTQTLADDKGGVDRPRPKEVRVQNCEPTNRNVIQGPVSGQAGTTHSKAQGSGVYGKWRGCMAPIYAIIRGGLPGRVV